MARIPMRLWIRNRIRLLSGWWEVSSCVSMGSMMGGWYAPNMMEHLNDAIHRLEDLQREIGEIESTYRA